MPTVVLTRERGKNAALRARLEALGIEPFELPLLVHASGPDRDRLEAALREAWDWVVVTSPEGARVLLEAWAAVGRPGLRVAAVGAGTARVLEGAGLCPGFVPSRAKGAVLARELPGAGRVLYPASAIADTTLETGLAARGFRVARLNVYTTLPAEVAPEEARRARQADAVTFASPSAVRAWVRVVGGDLPAACIGETTARAARDAGFSRVFYPERPGLEGWVRSVLQAVGHMT